jgi:hypothetical protein
MSRFTGVTISGILAAFIQDVGTGTKPGGDTGSDWDTRMGTTVSTETIMNPESRRGRLMLEWAMSAGRAVTAATKSRISEFRALSIVANKDGTS